MEELKKMVLAIANSISLVKSELLMAIRKVDNRAGRIEKKLDQLEVNLAKRIDIIGLSQARLEDDSPTIEEFDKLEKRVSKIEHQIAS